MKYSFEVIIEAIDNCCGCTRPIEMLRENIEEIELNNRKMACGFCLKRWSEECNEICENWGIRKL